MENIFKQLPSISQDTLQYYLYPPAELSDKASVTTLAACIQTYVESLLPDFIWHRDSFELKVARDPDQSHEVYILEGRMRVGDSVDDEWCSVWLLKEISAKWDVVISVFDSDGEFLLIEAAEALPSWVKPENSENRVWIYKTRLHLIPLEHVSPPSRKRRYRELPGTDEDSAQDHLHAGDDMDEYLAVPDAIPLIRNSSIPTLAPSAVETLVWSRIHSYPEAARNHVHRTNAYLPIDIARSLIKAPSLVQKAVETFYTRDAVQLRAAHRMNRFSPNTSTLSTVKMTRTAYAQLSGQKFYPPKVFGTWREPKGSKEWRWKDLGMKIAVGFEILYQESKSRSDVPAPSVNAESVVSTVYSQTQARIDALRRDTDYVKYIENLKGVGYFRGELEGSALWNQLEEKAAAMFIESRRSDDAKRPSFASQANAAAADISLQPSAGEEDSDEWLNVDAENLDAMLEQAMGPRTKENADSKMEVDQAQPSETPEERLASEQAGKLKDLADKVEKFVEGEGGLEGALFEDEEEHSSEDMGDSDDDNDSESDAEEVADEPTAAEKQAAMDKLVPALDPGDYGKMPASFYGNSQKVANAEEERDSQEGHKAEGVETIESPETRKDSAKSAKASSPAKPIRKPILTRDQFDGVDSDDETDSEEEADEESEEDKPQVVGDVEIDMEDEEEEFLEFSRQALGISDEQWDEIVRDRRERGAFLPASASKKSTLPKTSAGNFPASKLSNQEAVPPPSSPTPGPDPTLDSFEAVMKAMDAELERIKGSQGKQKPSPGLSTSVGKGKGKSAAPMDVDNGELPEDIEKAMDAELMAALAQAEGGGEDDDEDGDGSIDYNMIKNFLESFRSQSGLSGPVSNLAGRLQPGWQLPRDS